MQPSATPTHFTTDEQDAYREHMRELGRRGGLATVERHGSEYMREIGRAGFRVALDLGYGAALLDKLTPGYRAKFGRDPVVRLPRRPAVARSEPVTGLCEWPGCQAAAEQSHHIDGWRVSAAQVALCGKHHTEFHRAYRATVKVWRGRGGERPSPRAVAIGLGIGLPAGGGLEGLR